MIVIVLFVGLKFVFHASQFFFDDDQTLVDEAGGIDGYLVLVFDSLFIIHCNQHIEHIFGTGGGVITE